MDYTPTIFYACCTSCLYLVQVPTVILCTLFEIMKINLFHKHKLPLNEPIEYIYLALVIFTLVSTALTVYIQNCFDNWQKVVKWINSPIPFSCPKDYSYPNPSKSYYNACLIRFLNLMLMWIMFLTTFFFTVLALIPERKINDLFGVKSNIKNDDERKESDVYDV
ncbi:hypothetical protein RhiirA1_534444 [Rhizophagus irregularis]|uniref:Uncharacterized protein n=1 Tax=Rhizophagus irregularis TaxID=588596 RepID=A0A2I1E6Q7_9GLOM|nr:hypothetical protein RhiirA1_534444 [Rhizophagus irregularis]PKY17779.1 hypothetical protein RhiirB3_522246 [Rhizophagus irregularis]